MEWRQLLSSYNYLGQATPGIACRAQQLRQLRKASWLPVAGRAPFRNRHRPAFAHCRPARRKRSRYQSSIDQGGGKRSRKAIMALVTALPHSSVPRCATSPVLGIPPLRMSRSVVGVMTVGISSGRGSGRFRFGRDKDASHATIPPRKDHQRSDQDDGDDGSNCEPISAGWLWYQRRWRKEKWTSLFVAIARPVQAGAGQAERRPGYVRPDCIPHATATDAGVNASLRDVQPEWSGAETSPELQRHGIHDFPPC